MADPLRPCHGAAQNGREGKIERSPLQAVPWREDFRPDRGAARRSYSRRPSANGMPERDAGGRLEARARLCLHGDCAAAAPSEAESAMAASAPIPEQRIMMVPFVTPWMRIQEVRREGD